MITPRRTLGTLTLAAALIAGAAACTPPPPELIPPLCATPVTVFEGACP